MIFKCVMCDTVFTNKTILHTHFETHLTNQKVHVFKCPECTKLFSQRNSLLEHFKVYELRKEICDVWIYVIFLTVCGGFQAID